MNEISIVPFRYKYLSALNSLLNTPISMKTLPKIGYIALISGHPIAAGFLRKIEGGYAQIDTLAVSSHFGAILKQKGLNTVLKSLISDAKDMNCSQVYVIAKDLSILKNAEDIGFQSVDQISLCLHLKE